VTRQPEFSIALENQRFSEEKTVLLGNAHQTLCHRICGGNQYSFLGIAIACQSCMERTSSRKRRRRSHGQHYWKYWSAFFCALFAAAFVVHVMVKREIGTPNHAARSANHASIHHSRGVESVPPVFNVEKRKLYPYSVIPGGLEDVSDLRNAIANDPLVAAHYANFNVARAHIVQLDRDEAVHVSFRLNDRIYWTKKTLLLHRGETVITDGQYYARTRCGNRASVLPESPTLPKEPTAEAMDGAPKFPLVADIPEIWPTPQGLVPPVGSGSSGDTIPPGYFPIVGGGGPGGGPTPDPPPTSPITTPEPNAFSLLALGIFTLGSVRWLPFVARKLSRS
jgi:hypothetical protein